MWHTRLCGCNSESAAKELYVGFGYGWKFQGGSLTPYYKHYWLVDHYLFRDSTGAEYRLDQNNGGIWTSKEPGGQ